MAIVAPGVQQRDVGGRLLREGGDGVAEMPFGEWAAAHGPALKRIAVVLCANESAADDLVQDLWVKLLPRWRGLPEPGPSLDSYVRRALVNLHISRWRRIRRERAKQHLVAAPEATENPSSIDDRSALAEALAPLGRRQRAAVVLRYYCDLDDAAIADALGCSEATVRSQISRALARVRASAPALQGPTGEEE